MNVAVIMTVIRCPYCVAGDEFRPMTAHRSGRYVCGKCGHLAIPDDNNFNCHCRKCEELKGIGLPRCG